MLSMSISISSDTIQWWGISFILNLQWLASICCFLRILSNFLPFESKFFCFEYYKRRGFFLFLNKSSNTWRHTTSLEAHGVGVTKMTGFSCIPSIWPFHDFLYIESPCENFQSGSELKMVCTFTHFLSRLTMTYFYLLYRSSQLYVHIDPKSFQVFALVFWNLHIFWVFTTKNQHWYFTSAKPARWSIKGNKLIAFTFILSWRHFRLAAL